MSRWTRITLITFSFILAFLSLLFIFMFLSDYMMTSIFASFMRMQKDGVWRGIVISFFVLAFVASLASLVIALMSGRLRRARVRQSSLGAVDIGVDAIECIALNASKASQSGVKSAKARVSPAKGEKLSVRLEVDSYSGVELPAMMSKVQERVKKDIERYTGIEVAEVLVKVSHVDTMASRYDR